MKTNECKETQENTAYYAESEQSEFTLELVRERITQMINDLIKTMEDSPETVRTSLIEPGGLINQAIKHLKKNPIQLEKLKGPIREFAINLFEINRRITSTPTIQGIIKQQEWDIKEAIAMWRSEYASINQKDIKKLQKSYKKFFSSESVRGLQLFPHFDKENLPLSLLIRLMGSEILPLRHRLLCFTTFYKRRRELN